MIMACPRTGTKYQNWVTLCAITAAIFSATTHKAEAAGKKLIRFDELSRYLGDVSDGAIQETAQAGSNCRNKNSSCGEFELKNGTIGKIWDSKRAMDDEQIQDLFRVDESRYIANEDGISFADAKERYYDRVHYNSGRAGYELPFENLRSWGSLNHPPVKKLTGPVNRYLEGLGSGEVDAAQSSNHIYFNEEFQRKLDKVSQTELSAGNVLQVLPGRDAHETKLAMIKGAKRYMWIQVMVMFCDPDTEDLIDAMIERKRAGVDVRVMLEGLWMRIAGSGCLKKLRKGGIDVLLVADSVRHLSIGVMHPKIWIRDGEEAIIGGKNIMASENFGNGFNDGYRDTDVWIKKGPAITDAMAQYADTWDKEETKRNASIDGYWPIIRAREAAEREAGVRGVTVYRDILSDPERRMNGVCRVVSQARRGLIRPIAPVLTALAENATSRILATTPKLRFKDDFNGGFNKTDFAIEAIVNAAKDRGVRVDLLTNGIDGMAGDLTSLPRRFRDWAREKNQLGLESLFQAVGNLMGMFDSRGNQKEIDKFMRHSDNIHVWQYFRYTHQKVQVFDHVVVGIGSFNLDGNSGAANHEAQMFCMDKSLVTQTEAMFARDVTNSVPAPRF